MYIHSKYTKLLLDKQLYQNATQTIYYLCPSLCLFAVMNCTKLMFVLQWTPFLEKKIKKKLHTLRWLSCGSLS